MERGECLVRITKSFTKNLGNFNSARVEYGVEKIVPNEMMNQTTQELSLKVDDFLQEELIALEASNQPVQTVEDDL